LRAGDRVAVMTFSSKARLGPPRPLTGRLWRSGKKTFAFKSRTPATFRGSTHCYDGIFDAATFLREIHDDNRRRAGAHHHRQFHL